jgi:hypothetical protein
MSRRRWARMQRPRAAGILTVGQRVARSLPERWPAVSLAGRFMKVGPSMNMPVHKTALVFTPVHKTSLVLVATGAAFGLGRNSVYFLNGSGGAWTSGHLGRGPSFNALSADS